MTTYAENAADRERQQRRRVQDRVMAERHHGFDLAAQDRHHKYERPSFAVVGEGSLAAQTKYREGYVRIFGGTL